MRKDIDYYKISIITVCYNTVQTIEQTILSVFNQSYTNIEYIIIDGGSTDGTIDIIKKYEDKLAYWVSESDNGIYDAMNKGLNIATGDYVQFLGSDDYFTDKNTVEYVVSSLTSNIDILSTGVYLIDEELKIQIYAGNASVRDKLKYNGDMIPHPGLFVKREIMKKFPFDTKYKSAADYDFFLKIYLNPQITFKYIDKATVFFALSGLSSTSRLGKFEHIKIMEKMNLSEDIIKIVRNNKNKILKKYVKSFLKLIGCLGIVLKQGNWTTHTCEWSFCRWCDNIPRKVKNENFNDLNL